VTVRPATEDDRAWIASVLRARWGGMGLVVRGGLIDAGKLPAFIAEVDGHRCGLATYEFRGEECELVSLDALAPRCGIGTALVQAVAAAARARGTRRLRVMTTNDNLEALRFYQRRGFTLHEIRLNAIAHSRRLKPTIPPTGCFDIPIRDEIDLVQPLE
jgi:DNA-3-methyladenine glycosylase I